MVIYFENARLEAFSHADASLVNEAGGGDVKNYYIQ
jgi:hypothetical protein